MAKTIKTVMIDKDGYVDIKHFECFIDIEKVAFYKFKLKKDGMIVLKFYDTKRKLVKPYEK